MQSRSVPVPAVLILLTIHAALLLVSARRNAVVVDEGMHLASGISYWDHGEFWSYHHNPPLIRLLCAIPAVVADVPVDYSRYIPVQHDRQADWNLACDFLDVNSSQISAVFLSARSVSILLSLIGAIYVMRWSQDLYGARAALIAAAIWTFCPFFLAHGGLATPDVGATVLIFAASYHFWRYLRTPSLSGSVTSGVLLGLAESAKFTAVLLPVVWCVLAAVRFSGRREDAPPTRWTSIAIHAGAVLFVSILVLNSAYGWSGVGKRLGEFAFRSPSFTISPEAGVPNEAGATAVNRFRGTWLGRVPVPFPERYLLGFDDQLWDFEARGFYKYLGGELRTPDEPGWRHYYLYGLCVKWPLGSWGLLAGATALSCARVNRRDVVSELSLVLPALTVIVSLSLKTGLNSHVRYILPALPFLIVFMSRVGRWCERGGWSRSMLVGVAIFVNAVSVLHVHPHYLTYFNEAAGGPRGGINHLADSNLDWGQGLRALQEWLDEHAPNQRIQLAYFGAMDPRLTGIEYEILDPQNPKPGLQAVSATLLVGMPNFAHDGRGGVISWTDDAFHRFRDLTPAATPGSSIYVYDLTAEQAELMRAASQVGTEHSK